MKIDITKAKIKNAAKKLINDCSTPKEVTVRAIAKEAGVQIAMISYCFGSREELFYCIFKEIAIEKLKNDPRIKKILSSNIRPKEKLRKIHYFAAEFLIANYKYTKAVTGYVLLNRDLSSLNSISLVVEHYGGKKTLEECKIISYELSSVMQLAVNRYKALKDFCGYDLSKKEDLHKFIDIQIDLFLKD